MSRLWFNRLIMPILAVVVLLGAFFVPSHIRSRLEVPTPIPTKPELKTSAPLQRERDKIASADNRGALTKLGNSIAGLIAGKCSVRAKSVSLTGDWYDLIENEDDCWVVAYSEPGTVIGKDSRGKFDFTGLTRNPTRVRAKSGAAYFKYSLCPTRLRDKLLDWDCRPQTKSAQR